jgi:hypothetical protein
LQTRVMQTIQEAYDIAAARERILKKNSADDAFGAKLSAARKAERFAVHALEDHRKEHAAFVATAHSV